MSTVTFTVYGTPAPAGSKRGFYNKKAGRVIVTDDSTRSRPWKAQVADKAAETMDGRELLRGPLQLLINFYMPRPKGHYGAKGVKPSAPNFPAVKPDITKLLRAIEDACNGVVWHDDSQIISQWGQKFYGEPARAEIQVYLVERAEAEGRKTAA